MPVRLLILSELYYPEVDATGYFMTGIAEGLATTDEVVVRVLCGQPTYHERANLAPWREERRGVQIRRVWGTRCDPRSLLGRLLNLATISMSAFIASLREIRRGDCVLAVTNPPLMPFLTRLACTIKGGRMILLVHDVYPEVLAAVGMLRPRGWFWRMLEATNRWLYRSCERIIVLGRDMQSIVDQKIGRGNTSLIIPNWADIDIVRPEKRRNEVLRDRLVNCQWPEPTQRDGLLHRAGGSPRVILYCGNHGRTHDLETLLRAAERLAEDPSVFFLFVGEGSGKPRAMALAEKLKLANTAFVGRVAEHDLSSTFALADICVVAFKPGMRGVSVPSRMYSVMAAGRPLLAITETDSELGMVVAEERIGWICSSGDIDGVTEVLRSVTRDRAALDAMGKRAREAACTKYSRDAVMRKWVNFVVELQGRSTQ